MKHPLSRCCPKLSIGTGCKDRTAKKPPQKSRELTPHRQLVGVSQKETCPKSQALQLLVRKVGIAYEGQTHYLLLSWPVSDRLRSFSGCSWVNAGATGWGFSTISAWCQIMACISSVSIQNKERRVTDFSSLTFLRAVTKIFLPEQFLHSYLKEDFGTWQTSSSYL